MIRAVSMSHKTAPLKTREQFSLGPEGRGRVRRKVLTATSGVVVVETCNRVEIYADSESSEFSLLDVVVEVVGGGRPAAARAFVEKRGTAVVDHLFRVAAGLESAVIGETEVLGQVRTAFAESVADGSSGPVVSHQFHSAIRAGRAVRTKTTISSNAVSVPSLAARMASIRLGGLAGRGALVVGTGDAGRLAATALAGMGASPLFIANRNFERAELLATALDGTPIRLTDVVNTLPHSDVVLTSAGADNFLVEASAVGSAMAVREGSVMVLVDLAVPRSIDPKAGDISGVTLLDLDAVQSEAAENVIKRSDAVAAAEAVVNDHVIRFIDWLGQQTVVPTIKDLISWAESVRRKQVERAFRGSDLTVDERERLAPVLDRFSQGLVQQLLAPPIASIRDAGEREARAAAVRSLFRLGEQPEDSLE